MTPRLFLDANVLYSSLLRDLFLRLAVEGTCAVHWSPEVQAEWKRHLVAAGYDPVVLDRTQARMNAAFPHAQVTGYEDDLGQFDLPDPADRHVLAAALKCGAGLLVTFNLKDFPADVLEKFGVVALHPDALLVRLLTESPDGSLSALQTLSASFKAPPMSVLDIGNALEKLLLPKSARILRTLITDAGS